MQLKLLSQNLQKAPLARVALAITVDELAGNDVSGPALLQAEQKCGLCRKQLPIILSVSTQQI